MYLLGMIPFRFGFGVIPIHIIMYKVNALDEC